MKNSFSIIIPVHFSEGTEYKNRFETLNRAVRSVFCQQYDNWELIIVDDGSEDGDSLDSFAGHPKVKVIHQSNMNRAIARNAGMDAAENDWICWLDSDDEYCSHYLRALNKAINDFPDYKIFNFASIVYYPDHHSLIRPTFEPKKEGFGHEWFRAGGIATGSFIFRRDLWKSDAIYRIPDEASPYAFAAQSGVDMRLTENDDAYTKVGDNPEGAFLDGKIRIGYSLGNPFGDDFCQFYKLTRDNHSKPLDIALYIQYPRDSEQEFEEEV